MCAKLLWHLNDNFCERRIRNIAYVRIAKPYRKAEIFSGSNCLNFHFVFVSLALEHPEICMLQMQLRTNTDALFSLAT